MSNYIRISPFPSQEEIRELRYHLDNHKFFHKPVRVTVKAFAKELKNHTDFTFNTFNVIRIDWTKNYKNRYVVILTSKNSSEKGYYIYRNVTYVHVKNCGTLLPE